MTTEGELEYLKQLKENIEIEGNVLYNSSLPPYLRLHAYRMLKANNLPPILTTENTIQKEETSSVRPIQKSKKVLKAAKIR